MHPRSPHSRSRAGSVLTAVSVTALSLVASAQVSAPAVPTVTQELRMASLGRCLGTENGAATVGTKVRLVSCTNVATARWALHPTGHVRLEKDPTQCLVAKDASAAPGSPVELGPCADHPTAKWKFVSGLLRSQVNQDRCLAQKGADDTNLVPCVVDLKWIKWSIAQQRVVNPSPPAATPVASKPGVSSVAFDVSGHVEQRGDVSGDPDSWLGTRGKGLRLEAFAVKPKNPSVRNAARGQATWPTCLKLQYMAHVAGAGDTAWFAAPAWAGQKGRGLRIEGVAFRTGGSCGSDYTVEYSCHIEGVGDMPRVSNGAFCGTRGQGRQLEAIKLTVRKK